jgi:3',5'-cyclic-AMP phosphodiesterase
VKRRTFLRSTLAAAAVAAAPAVAERSLLQPTARRGLRFAFMTDTHVEPGRRAEEGFARALHAVERLDEPVDLIVNGGDAVFTALTRGAADVAAQFRTWRGIVERETSLPFVHCIGNHDVWGWGLPDPAGLAGDARFGKGWALEALELERPYYHVDRGGWRLVVLDSTHPGEMFSYQARLDDGQLEWLAGLLRATSAATPVCLISHIPLASFAATQWFGGSPDDRERRIIEEVLAHRDGGRVVDLVARHPNVRLCLSGHLHMEEAVEFRGVTHLNVAAVAGNWWNEETPAFRGFGPAFATVDLFADGNFSYQRHRLA